MIKMFIPIFCCILLKVNAQENKMHMGLYNIGLGVFTGGIGAVLNKKPDQKIGRVFFNGVWRGAVGGTFVHSSKLLAGQIGPQKSLEFSWLAKASNSLGTSIIQNVINDKDFLEQININVGFNRLEANFKNGFKISYKIMPISFLSTVYIATQSKFEPEYSLRTGEIIFTSNKFNIGGSENYKGFTFCNIMVMNSKYLKNYSTFGHEIIHIYQYYDYDFVNTYTHKIINKNSFLQRNSKIFYYDLQGPVLHSLYLLSNANASSYYGNFYEREAGLYSNTFEGN